MTKPLPLSCAILLGMAEVWAMGLPPQASIPANSAAAQQRYLETPPGRKPRVVFDYMGESGKTADDLRKEGFVVWTPPRAKGEFLGEGDTPTFLSLLDNGLEGWRQENRRNPGAYQTAGATNIVPFGGGAPPAAPGGAGVPGAPGAARGAGGRGANAGPRPPSRFLRPLMHDFAERLTWAITPKYADANHAPMVTLKNARLSGKPGDVVTLSAKAGDTIHIVAEANDDGTLPLTRYARAIVTVR